jgi:hypothetical protein
MPGAGCARSLVCEMKKHTSIVTTVTPETPGIPRAMVLTAYSALSPVTGLVCHRRQRSCLRQLDASVGASGPHDFAVRRSAPSSEAPPASTASRPAFVTIASRPSKGTGPNRNNPVSTWLSSKFRKFRNYTNLTKPAISHYGTWGAKWLVRTGGLHLKLWTYLVAAEGFH